MRLHIYNQNINDDFLSGYCTNSMHVFLSGFIDEAEKKYEVKLYGNKSNKKLRNSFFFLDILLGRKNKKDLVLVFGYNTLIIFQLIILRLFGFKAICYLFDSHKLNNIDGFFKKNLFNAYYNLGFYLTKYIDFIICVNSNFEKKYRKKYKKIILSKIPYKCREINNINLKKDPCDILGDNMHVLYGGTLNFDNGAHLVLELVRKSYPFDIKFIVYGYGDYEKKFELEAFENKNLIFIGKKDNEVVRCLIRNSDVCLHLRDPESVNKDIAFPSKLIEYLFNSECVLSNDFLGLNDNLKKATIYLGNFEIGDLYDFILNFQDNKDKSKECNEHRMKALRKVREEYGWDSAFNEIYEKINS